MCREVAAIEIARGPLIKAEEVCAVEPFEVEQLQDRLSHAHIGEDRAPRIEHQALHALWQSVRQIFLDGAAIAHCRKVVSGLPAPRVSLDPQIVEPFLERLEMRVAVAVVVEADLVEVEAAAVYGQVTAPVVGIAHEADRAAGVDLAHLVGARTKRRLESGILVGVGVDRVLGKHRHQPEDERDLAVAGRVEGEADDPVRQTLRLRDLGEIGAVVGATLGLEQLEREQHVVGRDRLAVGEVCLGVEMEGDRRAVFGNLDAFGHEPVEREGLVEAARHETLDGEVANAVGGDTLDDEWVEVVERPVGAEDETPAFGRVGIDVGEMREARRLLGLAVEGNGVHRLGLRGKPRRQQCQSQGDDQPRQHSTVPGRGPLARNMSSCSLLPQHRRSARVSGNSWPQQ